MSGMLHLAASVDLPGECEPEPYLELVGLAERGGLDFVTVGDPYAAPGLDTGELLARVAAVTRRIGLVAMCGGLSAALSLDRVSRGRAGWRPEEAAPVPVCPALRIVDATEPGERERAARDADVALVRAVSPGEAAGVREQLRSRAVELGRDPDTLRVLAGLLIDLGDGERAAERGHGGGGPRPTAQGPLYRGGPVDLTELIAGWHREGAVDGFHLTPVEPRRDLERLVNGTVGLLQHRGLFRTFYPGGTLREHLGLGRYVVGKGV